jgi:hypothetical protein
MNGSRLCQTGFRPVRQGRLETFVTTFKEVTMVRLITTIIVSITILRWFRRRYNADWNRRRWRNYEAERAMQALRGLILFLFVAVILALAFGWKLEPAAALKVQLWPLSLAWQ